MKTKKKTNKQRKRLWILKKNLMRKYSDCNYAGDFFCNHVYDPKDPWQWVDFTFFHTTEKRYYAVAMTTCAYEKVEAASWEIMDKHHALGIPPHERVKLHKQELKEMFKDPVTVQPSFEIKDYGLPTVGVWVTINVPYIDEHEIRKFISFFREMGQPSTPGFKWVGEEVQIDAGKIL